MPHRKYAALGTRFYGAVVHCMSAQACDGACTVRLKRLVEIALSAWSGDPAYRKAGHRTDAVPAAEIDLALG